MGDDKRNFVWLDSREGGSGKDGEIARFTARSPREAALKAASRLDPAASEAAARANPERIWIRERNEWNEVHIFEGWAWEEPAPEGDPDRHGDPVTKADVSKVQVMGPMWRLGFMSNEELDRLGF